MHRRALRPWLVAAAGLLVLAGGAVAVQLRGGHWASLPHVAIATNAPAAMPAPGPVASPGAPPATPSERPAAPTAVAASPQPSAVPAPTPPATPAQLAAAEPANPAAAPAPRPAPSQPALRIIKPSFDVVRVNALGSAVMAGRADPGADVTIHDGERELGRVKADDQGQWVFLPNSPLAPGSRELTLSERTSGGAETRADGPVLLVVPERKPELATNPPLPPLPPLAVLTPDNPASMGGARLLQPPPASGIGTGARLGLDLVQYDDHGAIGFSGSAPPGSAIRLYVDNHKAGDALADATGRWSVTPQQPIGLGKHHVRVDQLTAKGAVTSRVELPFSREVVARAVVADGHVTVQPGENLWRLARHVYGTGLRYTVIYQANREQIRDPRMIYPGQNFAVPDASPSTETPPGNPSPGGTAANKPG